MAAGDELAARARRALDIVSRDAPAREQFIAGYTGTGDAMSALRSAATAAEPDPLERERLDAIRKIAFGRTHNAEEESAAAAALQEIRAHERRNQQNLDALELAIRALERAPAPTSPAFEDPAPGMLTAARPARLPRGVWIVPIVAVSLAIGYGGAALSGSVPRTAPSPSISDTDAVRRLPPLAPGAALAGSPSAADEWFAHPQSPQDTVDAPQLLADLGIVATTTRFVQTTASGSSLWIAKRPNGNFCVVGLRPGSGGAFGTCATHDEFLRRGLSLTNGHDTIRWDGIKFSTSSYAD